MNRHLIGFSGMLAFVIGLVPSAGARRDSNWSKPENLGPIINSVSNDAGPAISKDGLSQYFHSQRPDLFGDVDGENDIYVARRESVDHDWDSPVNLKGPINTDSFEVFPALSRDEHHLFFARGTGESGDGPADVWVSYRKDVHDDFAWQAPTLLGPAVNTAAGDSGVSYFENRERGLPQLYFNSNRPGGLGGNDIYVADAFGPAVLVKELSSLYGDARPAISRNGLEIFFNSNRPRGTATPPTTPPTPVDIDLWVSVRKSVFHPWSPPVNLGTTVNSLYDDSVAAISSDGETLFFTSNRPHASASGLNDIWMTTRTSVDTSKPATDRHFKTGHHGRGGRDQ